MKQCLKKAFSLLLAALLSVEVLLPQTVYAQQPEMQLAKAEIRDPIGFNFNMLGYDTSAYIRAEYWENFHPARRLSYTCANRTKEAVPIKIESSNTDVVEILSTTETERTLRAGGVLNNESIYYDNVGVGVADIVVTVGDNVYKKRVYSVMTNTEITKITQTAYRSVTIEWDKVPGSSGYRIVRHSYKGDDGDDDDDDDELHETVATLYGENQTSVTVSGDWEVSYRYQVISFVQDDIRTMEAEPAALSAGEYFIMLKKGAEITAVETSGSDMIVRWDAMEGALRYELYRSEMENAVGNCVYTTENNSRSFTYREKVTKGTTYYYKLVTVYPEGKSDISGSVAQFIPGNGKKRSVHCKTFSKSGYIGLYPGTEITNRSCAYYYQKDGKFHVVRVHQNKKKKNYALKVYTMDTAMKVKSKKTIKLDSFDTWGGFYQGIDGNFYVVIGYNNFKESKKKTVIKVIKYSSKWKKMKTASIKGGGFYTFEGITVPFDFGNCRMDMQGTTLYIMTSRQMFTQSDGIRHQSNIGFEIDTINMKAKTMWDGYYVSHSFNQFIKYKDHALYILDHGDAYPRALNLEVDSDYGMYGNLPIMPYLFSFKGKLGNNFTGCEVGSMEIGRKNVLVCGAAQPHKHAVKGVTGFGGKLKYNVYLILANRKTGKVKFQWLTDYNPKTSSVSVGIPQMVKLAEDRFAILYTTQAKKKKTLHYVVVNDIGEKIYSKTFAGMDLTDESQPILFNGSIVWTETDWLDDWELDWKTTLYSVPAVY